MICRLTAWALGATVFALLLLGSGSDAAAGGTGSITGRLFLDLDADGGYDPSDVLLNYSVFAWGPTSSPNDDNGGSFYFGGLEAGTYNLGASAPYECSDIGWRTWYGVQYQGFCRGPSLPTAIVEVSAGEQSIVDLPVTDIPGLYTGRLWITGAPAEPGSEVEVRVNGNLCETLVVVEVSGGQGRVWSEFRYDVPEVPPENCDGEDITFHHNGTQIGAVNRTSAWRGLVSSWLYNSPIERSADFVYPPSYAMGILASTTTQPGDMLRAIVGGKTCATAEASSEVTRLFVADSGTIPGCGQAGDLIVFCVDGQATFERRTWNWDVEFISTTFRLTDDACPLGGLTGDVDCDTYLTVADVLELLRHEALGTDPDCIAYADSNCDGIADAVDARLVLQDIVRVPTDVPVGCAGPGQPRA